MIFRTQFIGLYIFIELSIQSLEAKFKFVFLKLNLIIVMNILKCLSLKWKIEYTLVDDVVVTSDLHFVVLRECYEVR